MAVLDDKLRLNKNYEIQLNEKDLEELAKKLKRFANDFERAKKNILLALAEYTKERIIFHIENTIGKLEYEPTGRLVESITQSDIFNDTIRVYTELSYAKYVEYGTGIMGSMDSHQEASQDGWIYNLFKETKGQFAHKFMFNAFKDLEQNYMTIVKGVLKKEGIL